MTSAHYSALVIAIKRKLHLPSPTPINRAFGSGYGKRLGKCKSQKLSTTTTVLGGSYGFKVL
jgi:hypothetical protein